MIYQTTHYFGSQSHCVDINRHSVWNIEYIVTQRQTLHLEVRSVADGVPFLSRTKKATNAAIFVCLTRSAICVLILHAALRSHQAIRPILSFQ